MLAAEFTFGENQPCFCHADGGLLTKWSTEEAKNGIRHIFSIQQLIFVSFGAKLRLDQTAVSQTNQCQVDCKTMIQDKKGYSPKTITTLTVNHDLIPARLHSFESLSVLNPMNIDLDTVLLERLVFLIRVVELITKLQILTPDHVLAGHRVLAFVDQVVHHLSVESMFRCAIPSGDVIAVDRQLEKVSNSGRMGPFDRVLEPDLTSGVDGDTARGNRVLR